MTDLPNAAADPVANTSTPDGETPAGDPELAALVRRDARRTTRPPSKTPAPASRPTPPRRTRRRRLRSGVDPVPVLPLAAVTDDEPPSTAPAPTGRSSSASASRSSWASCSPSASAPASCTRGASSTTPDPARRPHRQHGPERAHPRAGGGGDRERLRVASGPGRSRSTARTARATISYADVGRGPDTTALIDAALAAGRQGEPFANLIGSPQAAIHGVTLDPAVRYDRDKLTAAVETLATTIDQTPVDASVSAGQGGTYSVSPAKDGRAVDQAALVAALDQQLAALGTPASITVPVPVVPLPPAVATTSAETAKAAADRMAADVVVARGKDSWTIAGKSLAPLISFSTAADGRVTPVVDWSGLDPMLATLAKKVNQTPQDAGLKLVGGHVVATGTSREGRTLNVDRMKAEIIGEILARQERRGGHRRSPPSSGPSTRS